MTSPPETDPTRPPATKHHQPHPGRKIEAKTGTTRSHTHGKPAVPSPWQATVVPVGTLEMSLRTGGSKDVNEVI
jgi:hypothetical protein